MADLQQKKHFEARAASNEWTKLVTENSSKVDRDAIERARGLVREAVGIIIRSVTSIGPPRENAVGERAESAIRDIACVLLEQADVFELCADLKAALFDIGNGLEPVLPEDLRRLW